MNMQPDINSMTFVCVFYQKCLSSRIDILVIQRVSIHRHCASLHLYRPSLISFNCNCCFECRGLELFNQIFPQYFVFLMLFNFFSVSICLFLLFRNIINSSLFALYSATGLHHGFPGDSVVKNLPSNAGDVGSILGLERSRGEGNGNPLQYSC